MKTNTHLSLLLLGILILSACATRQASPAPATQQPDQPVSSSTPTAEPTVEAPAPGKVITGENAIVEDLQIMILESFPVQVNAAIRGSLPDGCTSIKEINPTRDGKAFNIQILTERSAEAVCTEALVPFEKTVSLEVYGLPAGTYTVKARDQTATFTLDVDNVPQAEITCPKPGTGEKLFNGQVDRAGSAYCFLYPADFEVLPGQMEGFVSLVGPKYGEGSEQLRANLSISTEDAAGRSLQEYLDAQKADYPGMTFVQEDVSLGGSPAIQIQDFPGRLSNKMVFTEHKGIIYALTFSPNEEAFPEAKADVDRLYASVIASWVFFE
jgi:inhibitor of cysteine peptidase